jgi:hypothetical protein
MRTVSYPALFNLRDDKDIMKRNNVLITLSFYLRSWKPKRITVEVSLFERNCSSTM